MGKSLLIISRGMWEPIGIVFAVSLVWTAIRMIFRGEWRNAVRWCYLLGGIGALAWRLAARITGARYHNVFLFIALFGIIDLFESFPLPRWWKRALFFAGLLCCLVHAVMYHPQDREVRQLYETVRWDAAAHSRVLGIAYDLNGGRHRYYAEIPLVAVDRSQPLAELLRGVKGNLHVYDGDYDAIYLFDVVNRQEVPLLPEFERLMPGGKVEKMGFVWLNRHRKKALVVYRYLPKAEKAEITPGALIKNGDFSRGVTPERRQRLLAQFGKSMPRLNEETFDPPDDWRFYQSLAGKSGSFFTRKMAPDGWTLHLEARGYLAAISPEFKIPIEKQLSFAVEAETDALLEISRGVQGGGLYPIVVLPLKAGEKKRYEITLPAYPGKEKSDIWFWLDHGTIDLKDVRIR